MDKAMLLSQCKGVWIENMDSELDFVILNIWPSFLILELKQGVLEN